MKHKLLFLLCIFSSIAVAGNTDSVVSNSLETQPVFVELLHSSGLPATELKQLLADCNASQQSLYFCAWRDQIAAKQEFKRVVTEKEQAMPNCKNTITADIASWERDRDQSCKKSSTKDWSEGSMEPTAEAICVAAETTRMTKQLKAINSCDKWDKLE